MVLYVLFTLAIAVQCGYAAYFFMRIFAVGTPHITIPLPERKPVSIIICAKNEALNLKKNLPAILAQRYSNEAGIPLYEVIVVNDGSTDDTADVLRELERSYDHLWDIVVPASSVAAGKKAALAKGVAYASSALLVLTDADCMPASENWLEQMIVPMAAGKELVLGYGGYNRAPGLLNAFIRWETLHTFLQYSTYALAGKPYMGVGRNMACTKETLENAQMTEVWQALPSGDDDLLVRIAGTAGNTAIVCNKEAFTYSTAKDSWQSWVRQKQRHLSTGKYYKRDIKALLGLYGISHAVMWIAFFALAALPEKVMIPVMWCMGLRCALYWTLWWVTAHKLGEKKLLFLFPIFDIGWMIYNFAFFPYISWKNKKHWT